MQIYNNELEKAGYDSWKTRESNRRIVEVIGVCPCCVGIVKDNNLFVEEDGEIYHLSCYNMMKAEEEE